MKSQIAGFGAILAIGAGLMAQTASPRPPVQVVVTQTPAEAGVELHFRLVNNTEHQITAYKITTYTGKSLTSSISDAKGPLNNQPCPEGKCITVPGTITISVHPNTGTVEAHETRIDWVRFADGFEWRPAH